MAIHGVLIQAKEQVEFVAMVFNWPVTHAHEKQDMSATNNRLVSVIGVKMQSAAYEDSGKNVTGGCYALAGFTSDGENVVKFSLGQRLILPSLPTGRDILGTTP